MRLLVIALLPMLVLLPGLLWMTVARWSGKLDSVLSVKVNSDLTIAHQYMASLLKNTGDRLAALAASVELVAALQRNTRSDTLFEEKRRQMGLDFLYLQDANGTVLASAPAIAGMPADDSSIVRRALAGQQVSAVDIFTAEELRHFSMELAERATVPLIETEAALPTKRTKEDRGMVLHAAAPLDLPSGSRGALVGGTVLNRNLDFIDTINALVYRARSLPEGSQGTATLFLDDVRISTNVRLFERDSERAIGTRVSAVVRRRVLDEGMVWLGRAFVVNDWYISAYEPIVDSRGVRVGMLYVGFLDAPFAQAKIESLMLLGGIFLAITAVSVPIFLSWAGRIFRPLEQITEIIRRVESGDPTARVDEAGDDEIGKVARHLDGLLDMVQVRDEELRNWAAELNDRVDERTRELRLAKQRLEEATQQLVMSEKLAAIGEITASIAHEINNPVAVIQGNLDVARQALGRAASPAKTEFDLIDRQIARISNIITKLLQFARPGEFSGSSEQADAREVLEDCLLLTRHQVASAGISVERELAVAVPRVAMDPTELQQVAINLIVNAIYAMPAGGLLTVCLTELDRQGVAGAAITVHDTGNGIADEDLSRIFEPFFTTKRTAGTGLGLAICQSLVTRAGGSIAATSKLGEGSRFDVWLPAAKETICPARRRNPDVTGTG